MSNIPFHKKNWKKIADGTKFKVAAFEDMKSFGIWPRFLSLVRTFMSEPKTVDVNNNSVSMQSMNGLIKFIKENFSFINSVNSLTSQVVTRALTSYPDFCKAYMSAQADLLTVVKGIALEMVEETKTVDAIETAMKVLEVEDRIKNKNNKSIDGVTVNVGIGGETQRKISELFNELENVPDPDFDSPDEEELAYDEESE